jgi:hypothetical protein
MNILLFPCDATSIRLPYKVYAGAGRPLSGPAVPPPARSESPGRPVELGPAKAAALYRLPHPYALLDDRARSAHLLPATLVQQQFLLDHVAAVAGLKRSQRNHYDHCLWQGKRPGRVREGMLKQDILRRCVLASVARIAE